MNVPTLLVIDDSEEIMELVRIALCDELIATYYAADAEEGLTLALALQPDLILLDVNLPPDSGFDICRKLKSDPATEAIPVAFLSGSDQIASKVQGLELGAVDYITKPFAPAELKARVRAALRTRDTLARLAKQATYDSLTSLTNRAGFDHQLHRELVSSELKGEPLCLLLLDIDNFKQLNDTYGHLFGDEVLRRFGRFLSDAKRPTDKACRYGGEEFVILMASTDLEAGYLRAELLRSLVAELCFDFQGQCVSLTVSGGLVCTSQLDSLQTQAQAMFGLADSALYAAKQEGRDRIVVAEIAGIAAGESAE